RPAIIFGSAFVVPAAAETEQVSPDHGQPDLHRDRFEWTACLARSSSPNLGVLLLEKRCQLFLNEAVEFVEHAGGESVAPLHDNLVAADRGRDLAFRGQHWLVIKVKVSVGHMRLL